MLKTLFLKLFTPPALAFYMLRHRSIWRLREVLRTRGGRLRLEAYYRYFDKRGSWISHRTEFAGEPVFPHGAVGVFISADAKIGKNAVIFQQVTIGSNTLASSNEGSPTIGDGAYLGAGAKIIGGVTLCGNCRVGANAVVFTDMPSNSVAVCEKTRIIQKDSLDNRYFRKRNDGTWEYYLDGKWHRKEN